MVETEKLSCQPPEGDCPEKEVAMCWDVTFCSCKPLK